MSDELTVNVIAHIRRAAIDPYMRLLAREHLAHMLTRGDLMEYQGRKAQVRPSDYGSCGLALWADIHGMLDLPRDAVDDQLTRLDLGSLAGAWEACLFKVAREADNTDGRWTVALEYVPIGGGHIDALCKVELDGEATGPDGQAYVRVRHHPVEFKSSWDSGAIKDPAKENYSHMLQVADYATRPDVGAPRFTLVYLKPSAAKGQRMKQFEYESAPWRTLVERERERLAPALLDEAPKHGDPPNRWNCYTCRAGWCKKNKNKMQDSTELLLA